MIPDASYDRFLSGLRTRLSDPLPGRDAQLEMAPLSRREHNEATRRNTPCREAAVLALVFPTEPGETPTRHPASLLLTIRPEGMTQHAGQVAFPGGRREQDEAIEHTALRETEEEVAIPRDDVQILGALTPIYVIPSNYFVYPFVGAIQKAPDLSVTSKEVAFIFGVEIDHLIDPAVRRSARRTIGERTRDVPYFALNGQFVWGATAMMLSEFAAVLRSVPD